MENFVTVLFDQRKVKKSVVEDMRKATNLPLAEDKLNYTIFETENNGMGIRLEIPYSLNEYQADRFSQKLADKLFEKGYDNFDIESSVAPVNEDENQAMRTPRRPELDAIVAKYAKPGATLADLTAMVREAEATKQADFQRRDDVGVGGAIADFGRDITNAISRRVDSADFRKRYVLAFASWELGLPGLYDPTGTSWYSMGSNGDIQSANGGGLDNALIVAEAGLLPPTVMERLNRNFSRFDNVQPGDTQGRRTQQKIQAIRAAFERSQGAGAGASAGAGAGAGTPGPTDGQDDANSRDSGTGSPYGDAEFEGEAQFIEQLRAMPVNERQALAVDIMRQLEEQFGVIGETAVSQKIYFMLNEGATEDAKINELARKLELIILMDRESADDAQKALAGPNLGLAEQYIERSQKAIERHRAIQSQGAGTDTSGEDDVAGEPQGGTDGSDTAGDAEAGAEEAPGVAFEYRGKTYYADPERRTLQGKNYYRTYENAELTPTPRWPKRATEGNASGIYDIIEAAIAGREGQEMGYDPALPNLQAFLDKDLKGLANDPDEKEAIDELQSFLRIPRTGVYDEATVAAVKAYQEANGLTVDGDAGPETIAHMKGKQEDGQGEEVAEDKWANAKIADAQPDASVVAIDVGDGVIATVPAERIESGVYMVTWGEEGTPTEEQLPDAVVDIIYAEIDKRETEGGSADTGAGISAGTGTGDGDGDVNGVTDGGSASEGLDFDPPTTQSQDVNTILDDLHNGVEDLLVGSE